MDRAQILKYFIDEYFNEDLEFVVQTTGYKLHQVRSWYNGNTQPQKGTVEYIVHCALAPEFRIIVEFSHFMPENDIRPQLRRALRNYKDSSGIYAFYDSMVNLLYLGKASNLLEEMYRTLRRHISMEFPRGVNQKPQQVYEVVRFMSAYDVKGLDWADYPKHVESLMLRISKPTLNTNIGHLEQLQH